jgi:cysteine desulfurase family protein
VSHTGAATIVGPALLRGRFGREQRHPHLRSIVRRLYLDNAATSFPKPAAVYDAMLRYGREVGGTAGRGTYFEAREGGRVINQCRSRICRFINGESADHVIFTLNTTDALNLAIKGVVSAALRRSQKRPLHLVTTTFDHNSVLRPFNALAARGDIEWTCVPVHPDSGLVNVAPVAAALRPDTALVAISHVSNVTGVIQPVAEIGQLCRNRGIPFLVDAAQSFGHIPIDVAAAAIDLLAFPGHKGALGPLGTGGLYIRPGLEHSLDPLREGGTGSRSEDDVQPQALPDKYEPGSQNALGIAGLSEAIAWHLDRIEPSLSASHEGRLVGAMLEGFRDLDALGPKPGRHGLRLLGPGTATGRVGVFSMIHDSLAPHELAAIMEQEYGILGRAGLHCAPRAHAALGTLPQSGAYRLSLGPFITPEDISYTIGALREVVGASTNQAAARRQAPALES